MSSSGSVYNQLVNPYLNWACELLDEVTDITPARHGDQSEVFCITTGNGNYFLKIASSLGKEYENLKRFEKMLPVPKLVGFTRIEENDALLMSAIEGEDLAKLAKVWEPEELVRKYAEALKNFHSLSTGESRAEILVHGDFCLPNVIFDGDELAGFIDVGDARVASPEVDLSAAIWSLERNIGKGYGLMFLREYGISDTDEEYVEMLRLKYENNEFDELAEGRKMENILRKG